jgi:hypothetical protein
MKRCWCLVLLAFGVLLLSSLPAQPAPEDPEGLRREILRLFQRHTPLTQGQLSQLLGKPQRKVRQILHMRYVEQWRYGPPLALDLQFECLRGQAPRLISVHLYPKRKP